MAAVALHSDHINYLVLRYLQEKGHERAATALYREWQRLPEFSDPEQLPFARVVRRDELISVIQEGLHHDELTARLRPTQQRRFQWTSVSAERPNGNVPENGVLASHLLPAGAKRKPRPPPPVLRQSDEFPTPMPKRVRHSEGSESAQVNGDRDMMDVDGISASAADADEEAVASPAIASPDPEIIEVPERYDSMDAATQTDTKRSVKTSTMYWRVTNRRASILQSVWNPSTDPKHSATLLTTGEGLCRFYRVPDNMSDAKNVLHIEEPSLPPNFVVTACAWHPSGRAATCATNAVRKFSNMADSQPILMDYSYDTGSSSRYLDPPLLEPRGVVIWLKYNEDGRYLLVVRTNNTHGLILIYPTALLTNDKKEPIAWRLFGQQILDAAWVDDVTFIASGKGKAVHTLTIAEDADPREQQGGVDVLGTQDVEIHGLKDISRNFEDLGVPQWDKLCISPDDRSTAAVCLETRQIARTQAPKFFESAQGIIRRPTQPSLDTLPGTVTSIAFQPSSTYVSRKHNSHGRLLAVAMEEGLCSIYGADDNGSPESPSTTYTLRLAEAPALALAWSPHGDYLAVCGPGLLQIWHVDDITTTRQPTVTWRPDAAATRPRPSQQGEQAEEDNEEEEKSYIGEPSLSWSADGQSIGFAIDRQIAIIRFRPPLDSSGPQSGINGYASP